MPSPTGGFSGELTGDDAMMVQLAALDNPEALWNVGGVVVWLIVGLA